jgi:UDPglucose 6-dehydrogenase
MLCCVIIPVYCKQITVIGCGYVGLTLASTLAQAGHSIVCVDKDQEKINNLNKRQLLLYEPYLYDALFDVKNSITFVYSITQALEAEVIYICVPTPTDATGACDCSMLNSCFKELITYLNNSPKIICVKSTIPPGTMRTLQHMLNTEKKYAIQLLYTPEFLREGSALRDIHNNPVVLAGESAAMQIIASLYGDVPTDKIIKTNFETAEILKYAWNAFSALRITYINELAVLCRTFNADIAAITQGLALSENLLPTALIKPGPGYGGSCLPKDTAAFAKIFEKNGFSFSLVHQVIASNKEHVTKLINTIDTLLGHSKKQKIVSVLGLSFKPNTGDIRNAPAINVIQTLVEKGIIIQAYDPQAMNAMKELFPHVHYCNSPYQAIKDADCIVVLTEWNEIKEIDFDTVIHLCNKRILVDTRNIYDPHLLKKYNFTYVNMARM